VLGKDVADTLRADKKAEITVTYKKIGMEKNEPNPRVYFLCEERTSNGVIPWNKDGYEMKHHQLLVEFGVNIKIEINALGALRGLKILGGFA